MRTTTKVCIVAGILLMTGSAYAQAEREVSTGFYRLDFVTKEMDDNKVINARTYSLIVSDKSNGDSMRTGSRLPIPTGTGNNYSYFDVGVNIDTHNVREVNGQLTLNVAADISAVAAEPAAGNNTLPPVVRQYKWTAAVIVPLRKATSIFSSDDLASRRKFQLELTATPIK